MNELKLSVRIKSLLHELVDASSERGRQLTSEDEQQFYATCCYEVATAGRNVLPADIRTGF